LCGCRGSSRGVGGNGRDGGCGSGTTKIKFFRITRLSRLFLYKILLQNIKFTYKSVRYSGSRGWSWFRHLPLRSVSWFFLSGGCLRRHVLRQSPTLLDLLEITTQRIATGCLNNRRWFARQCRFVLFVLASAISIVISFCRRTMNIAILQSEI